MSCAENIVVSIAEESSWGVLRPRVFGVKMNVELEINMLKAEIASLKQPQPLVEQKQGGEFFKDSVGSGGNENDKDKDDKKNNTGRKGPKIKNTCPDLFSVLMGMFLSFILYVIFSHMMSETRQDIKNEILLYSEKDYGGLKKVVTPRNLNSNTCYNLDEERNNFAASIDTQGECVYLFVGSDCRAPKLKFSGPTDFQHDLSYRGFAKSISSIQKCDYHGHWKDGVNGLEFSTKES